jgi:hypothetical protein
VESDGEDTAQQQNGPAERHEGHDVGHVLEGLPEGFESCVASISFTNAPPRMVAEVGGICVLLVL